MIIATCTIGREIDLYIALGRGNAMATSLGFDATDHARIEIVIRELTHNILVHAHSGELHLEALQTHGRNGLVIVAADRGPGIPNLDLALSDGYSTAQTLGAGLPGVRRLMDDFSIESTPGAGTRVRVVKWVKPRRSAANTEGR